METEELLAYLILKKIGVVRSPLTKIDDCPLQGEEGAPEAWLDIEQNFIEGLDGLRVGSSVLLLTWLHLANREILKMPSEKGNTCSTRRCIFYQVARPANPIGFHRVKILAIEPGKLKVHPLEALDGTLVIDIKPALPVDFMDQNHI